MVACLWLDQVRTGRVRLEVLMFWSVPQCFNKPIYPLGSRIGELPRSPAKIVDSFTTL